MKVVFTTQKKANHIAMVKCRKCETWTDPADLVNGECYFCRREDIKETPKIKDNSKEPKNSDAKED